MNNQKLTAHFQVSEFLKTRHRQFASLQVATADRLEKFARLAAILEAVRENFMGPIIITSGYRCPDLNRLVGGALVSDHLYGTGGGFSDGAAADFRVRGIGHDVDPYEVVEFIKENLDSEIGQVIQYEKRGFTHLALPRPSRPHKARYLHGRADGTYELWKPLDKEEAIQ